MVPRKNIAAATIVLLAAALPGLSQAQSLVKKVKCADAASPEYGVGVYRNTADFDNTATLQIVRDGCRPKKDAATFSIHITDFDGTTSYDNRTMPREGRNTWAVREVVGNGRIMRIKFNLQSSPKAYGTFDYVLIVH